MIIVISREDIMPKSPSSMDMNCYKTTPRRLGTWIMQVFINLVMIGSMMGVNVMQASAAPLSSPLADAPGFTFASIGDAQAEAENFTATLTQIASLKSRLCDLQRRPGRLWGG